MKGLESLSILFGKGPQQKERERLARNANAKSRRNAKKLAAKHGIRLTVERDYKQGWSCWIEDPRFDGEQFCTSWDEVEGKLKELL